MLSILLSLHSQMLAFRPLTAVVQLQRQEEGAGGEEWLYLISLFVRSKMFPRNQGADLPLHLGAQESKCLSILTPLMGKGVFSLGKRGMGMTVRRKPMASSMAALRRDKWYVCGQAELWSPG